MSEPSRPKFIRNALYPMTIRSGDDILYSEAKIIIGDSKYYIYRELSEGPTLVEEGYIYDYDKSTLTLITETDTYTLSKSGGCGCGSRLKHFNPFFGVPYGK